MASAYKNANVAGNGTFGTWVSLYQCPASTEAVISTISICNTGGTAATYGVAIKSTVGTPAPAECVVYNATVDASDSVFITAGITLEAGQYLIITSNSTSTGFHAFVSEIS